MKSYSAPASLFEQFALGWTNSAGRIESFIERVPEAQRPLILRGLLEIEFELCLKSGRPPVIADYVRRFPNAISDIDAALRASELRVNAVSGRDVPSRMLADTVIGEGTHDESLQKSRNDAPETISATVADVVFRFRESSENSRYNREQFHAAGGLGEVYKASDRQLNRTVALKQMKPEHANHEVGRARFVLEAVVTGNLEHPGIVPVYGLGEYSDGRPFYAMRFIEGQSLREAIDGFHGKQSADHSAVNPMKAGFTSLEFRQLLGRFVDVCQAVSYAHSRGVLHRDLKPGNVMLGKFGETLVVDWGLAKVKGKADPEKQVSENAADSNSGEDAGFTIDGRPYGTPAYMSPEQARGEVRQLGAETDVYSLGATLYHLLNGVTPHAGVPFSEILQQVQSKTLRPPAPVISGIPQQLTAICQKAMSFDPANRYSNPKDLAEDIERYLADEAVGALKETFIVKSLRWMRKNLVLVVASSAAALLLATIGVAYQSYRLQKSENDLLANRVLLAEGETQRQNAERQLAEANMKSAQRDALLSRVRPTRAASGDFEPRLQLYNDAMEYGYVDETARCDLMLAKYDLLRSVQRIEQAKQTLTEVKPVTDLQKHQVLLRRLQELDSQKEREVLVEEILRAQALLKPEELAFVKAIINQERAERIELLEEAVSLRPDFSGARELLITERLMNGDTARVYSLSHDGELLWPEDLFYQIAPAIAAAFAEDDPDFEKYKNRLTEKLHRVEDQRLLSLLDSVRGLSSLAEGWDSGQPFGVNDVVTILSFLNLVSSLESSSPLISDSLNRMRVNSIDLSSGETGPLLSLKLGDALLEDSKPFEDLLKETEIASPIVNDAFFPFIRGIICIANGQNEEAERVLEEAVDRPSVITRFHKESLYGLAMVYRLRFTANKDEGYLRKSAQTFERWLNSNPRITRVRLPASVYGSLDAGQSDLARRIVEYARIQLPPDAAEIFCCELLILNHEKNYLRVLELTSESALADSQWSLNAEHQAFVATMRTNALEKLRLEVEKVLPATGESSD